MHVMKLWKKAAAGLIVVPLVVVLAACGGPNDAAKKEDGTKSESAEKPQSGGTMTLLGQQGWPTGLDPATRTNGEPQLMNAIYGNLFRLGELDKGNGSAEVLPDLAAGYKLSADGLNLEIDLRKDVKFQDGTPFNSQAVAFNFQRALESPCACAPKWTLQETDGITTPDENTVVLHFAVVPVAPINSFLGSNANWIASPTAVASMGDDFKTSPVGAGPFKVVSNKLNAELVLEANKSYFAKGLPYLDRVVFKPIEDPQVGYQAILAGQADAFIGVDSKPLIELIRQNSEMKVTDYPPTTPMTVQLNTLNGPFASKKAREAIYYATDVDAINKGLFGGSYEASQMFTAPGGLFNHSEVPDYRTYDLKKAAKIVKSLGGLEVTLGTIASPVSTDVITALQSQWEKAGIKTTIQSYGVPALLQEYKVGEWDAMLRVVGGWDPAAGLGVSGYFASTGKYSGVDDPKLDDLLKEAGTATDSAKRDELYFEAGKLMSSEAYAPFLFAYAPAAVAHKVHGPGLTTPIPPVTNNSDVMWDQLWKDAPVK